MSGTTGVVFWVVLALVLVALETVTVAFIGIYLAAGALVWLFYGPQTVQWYLGKVLSRGL